MIGRLGLKPERSGLSIPRGLDTNKNPGKDVSENERGWKSCCVCYGAYSLGAEPGGVVWGEAARVENDITP